MTKLLPSLCLVALTISLATCHHTSVIVIGAGASGMMAAARLLRSNMSDVAILEAEDRIGGRVHTVPCGEHHTIELGAQWVYGKTGNVIYDKLKEKDLLDMLIVEHFDMDIIFSNGKAVGIEKSAELMGIFLDLMNNPDKQLSKDKTSGEHFIPAFTEAVNKKYHDDPKAIAEALKTLPMMEHMMELFDSSFSWNDTSVITNYNDVEDEMDGYYAPFKGKGFKQIFDILDGKIPTGAPKQHIEEKVQFNKVVTKINYAGEKPVVTMKDGTELTADVVIFTPSVGVLKHEHESMFEPALPEDKVAAINDLGMDAFFKVVMHYNNPWWNKDTSFYYHFVFGEDDENEIAGLFPDGPMKDGKSWLTGFLAIAPAEDNPNVAYAWFTGSNVPEMENMSHEDIMKGINFVVNKFMGSKITPTKPDKVTTTDWYTNPHFRGVASYETLKSHRDGECVHMILARPLKNKDGKEVVFFAGEATHKTHYATVHGALESGDREAKRIINLHKS